MGILDKARDPRSRIVDKVETVITLAGGCVDAQGSCCGSTVPEQATKVVAAGDQRD
ncbi:antitoxin [Mycobacterium shinjukuense]|uniref:Uncharacterized protein n=1 Tax=Mycobacterium shinjukuense TaxID=398694 RepID=A0A7I7MK27_9MYCO|nr:antitoxin [Mycobacterium shinjukuense]MCV6984445.1 antitoxin [Mycobacterium shinjukuense]BBX72170.1 hypothetical protein MSHI_00760 [Mycobacterium shinjukuense]